MGAKREPYHFVNFDCAPSPSHTHRPQTKWKTMEQLDFAFAVYFPSCCARAGLLSRGVFGRFSFSSSLTQKNIYRNKTSEIKRVGPRRVPIVCLLFFPFLGRVDFDFSVPAKFGGFFYRPNFGGFFYRPPCSSN